MTVLRSVEIVVLLAVSLSLAACEGGKVTRAYTVAMNGNPRHGRQLIQSFGCGGCHTIPGIPAAHGVVGPPLMFFSRRTMIAGELPNNPQNLVRWIVNAPGVEPKTAMPNLGITDAQAHDIAAYLYTLR